MSGVSMFVFLSLPYFTRGLELGRYRAWVSYSTMGKLGAEDHEVDYITDGE